MSDETTPEASVQQPAHLLELAKLQEKYDALKVQCADAYRKHQPHGKLLADKGDVFNKITALKRKHDLP